MDAEGEGDTWEGGGRRYKMEKVVGNGAFGIVWRARDDGGALVAIKKVVLDRRYHNRELEMMKQLQHEYIIKLRNFFEKPGRKRDETYLHLVMDFMPETVRSVSMQYHKQRVRFPVDHARVYLYQAFRALEYVHSKSICHRDLKPDNLLVDPLRLQLKLIDFGCAKVLVRGQPNVSYICSRYYRAPELLFGATEYTCSLDMWSMGTILAELLLGHLPFQGQDSTQQHLIEIMKLLGTPTERDLRAMRATCTLQDLPKLKAYPWERVFPSGTSARAIDLAHRLLCYDPAQRLSASQALEHPFFESVQYLLSGTGNGPPLREQHTAWQKKVQKLVDEYVSNRTEKALAKVSEMEQTLSKKLAAEQGADDFVDTLRAELGPMLASCDEVEARFVKTLGADLRGTLRPDGKAGETEKLTDAIAEERKKAKAEAAKAENAALRAKLAELTTALEKKRAIAEKLTESGCQTDEMPVSPAGGRRATRGSIPCGSEYQASPMIARPSVVYDSSGRGNGSNLGAMPTDNLGAVTPLGFMSRESSVTSARCENS